MERDKAIKGLQCCSEFLCGECPYNIYENKDYPLRCVYKMMEDLNKSYEIIENIKNGKMHRKMSCCDWDCTQMTMWMTPNYCPNCGASINKNIVEMWKYG